MPKMHFCCRAMLPDSTPRGTRIGRYQLIRRLAVGGMAEIFLARVPGLGIEGFEKLVVLKRILPQPSPTPSSCACSSTRRGCGHARPPERREVHDVGAAVRRHFFAMEYLHGANLRGC